MTQTIKQQLALCDSPQKFFALIPTGLRENIEFRIKLAGWLATDTKAQDEYLRMCKVYLPIMFNTIFMTLNPQLAPRLRNQPFILRPAQIPAVEALCACIDEGRDVGINKSRKQGASELCAKVFAGKAILDELSHFILGSRKEDLVDKTGDLYTLFSKVDNAMQHMPFWLKKFTGYDEKNDRTHLLMRIPYNNSRISGEATNESFAAGSRSTAILLDEFGRVDYTIAKSIEGSIHDVSDCVIYSSTHWLGQNHPFNIALKKPSTETLDLMWYTNPSEAQGLYRTPEPGVVELVDVEYYRQKHPEVLKYAS